MSRSDFGGQGIIISIFIMFTLSSTPTVLLQSIDVDRRFFFVGVITAGERCGLVLKDKVV